MFLLYKTFNWDFLHVNQLVVVTKIDLELRGESLLKAIFGISGPSRLDAGCKLAKFVFNLHLKLDYS